MCRVSSVGGAAGEEWSGPRGCGLGLLLVWRRRGGEGGIGAREGGGGRTGLEPPLRGGVATLWSAVEWPATMLVVEFDVFEGPAVTMDDLIDWCWLM